MPKAGTQNKLTAAERLLKSSQDSIEFLIHATNKIALAQTLDAALEQLIEIVAEATNSERGSVFIKDKSSDELFSRVAQGNFRREIRILSTRGIAGWVYTNNESIIIKNPYEDPRFAKEIDQSTGYQTKSILSAPLRTVGGKIIGVTQLLNKKKGVFTKKDLQILEAVSEQATVAIQGHLVAEDMNTFREKELEYLEVVSQVSSELNLTDLLNKIITAVSKMLDAERSTLFINDEKTNELYTVVGEGLGAARIRFPNHVGIAGAVFQSKESINIPHAYADLRFNPSFDKQTGFFTRSMLCTPVLNKEGAIIGVAQVLNKIGGVFTKEDESRLAAFTSQIAIGIENAKLFDDVQSIKNYNESILESMSNGVITTNDEGTITKCNLACRRILKTRRKDILQQPLIEFFSGANQWVNEKVIALHETLKLLSEINPEEEEEEDIPVLETSFIDRELEFAGEKISVNMTILPLTSDDGSVLGTMLLIEDISGEKRMKSTMSRYMSPELTDKLLASGEELLGGKQSIATVLFSDVRSFTTITETLGAQGTVSLINDYFTVMVDCIQNEGGMLDKFIGDAMMAIFGTPFPHEDDPDRGVRAAIEMMVQLKQFNERRVKQGLMTIDHGMGLNTDSIVSGNIGSPKRMDYTVIGDVVNLAARLESACKQYGARILISENTFNSLKATYRTREIDRVIVKGKTEPVGVYEVMDYHDESSFPNMIEVLGHFNSGFKLYQKGDFSDALKSFKEAQSANSEDKCSLMYIDRCQQLIKTPPKDWNGVWVLTSK